MSDTTYHIEMMMQDTAARDNWTAVERTRICYMLKPKLSIDGDKWCALYGENLQDGVAGFGDSPAEAYKDFDKNWYAKLKEAKK